MTGVGWAAVAYSGPGMAERDQVVVNTVPVPKNWYYLRHNVPVPQAGEETIGGAVSGQPSAVSGKAPDVSGAAAAEQKVETELDAMKARLAALEAMGNENSGRYPKGSGDQKVSAHPRVFQHLGIAPGNIYADYNQLAAKHPEYFKDSDEAKLYVEHVFARPTHILNGNAETHKLIVRSDETGHNMGALDIEQKGGKYRVVSTYPLSDRQFREGVKATGPGAALGVSRVDSHEAKTPSRSLGATHAAPPAALESIRARFDPVNFVEAARTPDAGRGTQDASTARRSSRRHPNFA